VIKQSIRNKPSVIQINNYRETFLVARADLCLYQIYLTCEDEQKVALGESG